MLTKPRGDAARVAVLKQFRSDFRPQFVLALDALRARNGRATWYRIIVPGRPNGRSGWVRAGALDLHPVKKRLIIYRGARRFEFWHGSRLTRAGDGRRRGVHGTPWPELLGQAVSHGCVRLHNDDILFLRNRLPLGTPVKIVC